MLILLLQAALAGSPAQMDAKAVALLEQMLQTWENTKTVTFRMHKTERLVDGTVMVEVADVKVRKPKDFYLHFAKPHAGREVIHTPKRSQTEITAHRGVFPDMTGTISMYGGMATSGQHHLVTHTGFDYQFRQIRNGLKASRASPNGEQLEYGGTLTLRGKAADKIILHSGTKPPLRVTAERDESLYSFARRMNTDAYLIAYSNESLDELTDSVEEGEVYVVPSYYGKKTEIVIDRETHLPLRTTIWGFDGNVYERFDYSELRVNPPLSDLDFDPENPAYNF